MTGHVRSESSVTGPETSVILARNTQLAQVYKVLQEPEMIVGVHKASMALRERPEMDEPTVLMVMHQMSKIWENLFPIEQNRIMRLLIGRVQLHENGLDIICRDDSWQRFCRELERHEFVAEQRAPSPQTPPPERRHCAPLLIGS